MTHSASMLLAILSGPAHATDFYVDTTVDAHDFQVGDCVCDIGPWAEGEGTCSLRAAVEEADACAPGDGSVEHVVDLPSGVFPLTLTGAGAGGLVIRLSGLPIRIIGEGPSRSTIDPRPLVFAGSPERALTSWPIARALTLESLSFVGVGGTGGPSAGLVENHSPLTVRDTIFLAGQEDAGDGAAILSYNQLTVQDSDFFDNRAAGRGGAIASFSRLEVDNSDLYDNTAEGHGGAIYADAEGPGEELALGVQIRTSALEGNYAYRSGGAIWCDVVGPEGTYSLEIWGSAIRDNIANGNGGGLFSGSPRVHLNGVSLEDNWSGGMGAGACLVNSHGGTGPDSALFNHSAIIGNDANGDGGGLHIGRSHEALIQSSTLSGNVARGDGGGLHVLRAQAALWHATVAFNTSTNEGGGAWADPGTLTLENSVFEGNFAATLGTDCAGGQSTGGWNVYEDATDCVSAMGTGDIVAPAMLQPLVTAGVPGDTRHLLGEESPAWDLVPGCSSSTYDQVGTQRDTTFCDSGAVEMP